MTSLLLYLALTILPATCEEAIAAQDEVVALQDSQIAELKAALVERKAQIAALEGVIRVTETEAATYKRLWLAEAEFGAAERKRAVWAERWTAVKWTTLGFSGGVLLERFAD